VVSTRRLFLARKVLKPFEKVPEVHFKCLGEPGEVIEPDAPHPGFKLPDVGALEISPMSELLLREPKFRSASTNAVSELPLQFCCWPSGRSHSSSQTDLLVFDDALWVSFCGLPVAWATDGRGRRRRLFSGRPDE
jgi:hypothetical protein